MANFEVPSFSLGLDDTPPHSPIHPPLSPDLHVSDSDSDSDPESRPDPPRPLLKRLRRGPPPPCLDPDADADDDIEDFSSQEDPDQGHAVPSAWNRNHSVCSSSKVSLNRSGVLTPHSCSNSFRDRKRKELSNDVPASARLETGKSGLMFPKLTTSPLRRFQLIDSDSDDADVGVGAGTSDANKVNPNSHLEQEKKTSADENRNEDLWKDFSPVKNVSVNRFQLLSDSDDSDVDVGGANKVNTNSRLEQDNKTSVDVNGNKDQWKDFLPVKNVSVSKFQLLSDSDDSDVDVDVGGANKANPNRHLEQNKKTSPDDDLWKDFLPVKNVSVPTPAFNEICEEYFRSANCKEVGGDASKSFSERNPGVSSSCQRYQQRWESTDPVHPAHSYFFHEDPRIQQLVRSRLRNFNPLGTINTVNQQPNFSHIDYMGQFGNGGASNMQGVQNGFINCSTRGGNKSSNLNVDGSFNASGGWVDPKIVSPFSHGESSRKKATKRNGSKNSVSKSNSKANKSNPANQSCASGGWVEPRSCTSLPKDAGKRRVQASGESAGHWFTSPEGRKV
ncbi:hypothetical protein AAZV13_14G022500 [Glycine max]|nr:hypothetical protein D0Y65_037468 [Glycine soja]